MDASILNYITSLDALSAQDEDANNEEKSSKLTTSSILLDNAKETPKKLSQIWKRESLTDNRDIDLSIPYSYQRQSHQSSYPKTNKVQSYKPSYVSVIKFFILREPM